ncbi:hypothetical protein BDZ91DRAFT_680976, partial [Kalaharituber pfeilii]
MLKSRESKTRVFVLVISSCILLTTLLSIFIWRTTTIISNRSKNGTQCVAIPGNQDMYGLGIRLGLYLHLIIIALSDILDSNKNSLALTPNTLWFLIALFAALLTMLQNAETYAIETYIVISLGNGITSILLGGTIKIDPLTLEEAYLTSFGRFMVWGLWRVLSTLYWWSAIDVSSKSDQSTCGNFVWFFLPVNLFGGFRTFHKVMNVFSWVGLIHSILPYFVGTILLLYLLLRRIDTSKWASQGVSKFMICIDYLFVPIGELRKVVFGNIAQRTLLVPDTIVIYIKKLGLEDFPFLIFWDLSTVLFTIMTVEFSLVLNNVVDIYHIGSAGQLIPVVMGMGGALTAVCNVY